MHNTHCVALCTCPCLYSHRTGLLANHHLHQTQPNATEPAHTTDPARPLTHLPPTAVISCQGRTFPVEHLFLEDVYEATGYALDPESRAALRSGQAHANAVRMKKQAAGGSRWVGLVSKKIAQFKRCGCLAVASILAESMQRLPAGSTS